MRTSMFVLAASLCLATPVLARDAIPKDVSQKELLEYLKTGSEDARKEACDRLGDRKDPSTIAPIAELVAKDASIKVRVECIHTLEKIGPDAASAAAVRTALLNDLEKKVRERAANSLQDVDPEKGGETAALALAKEKETDVKKQLCSSIYRKAWKAADAAVQKVVTDANENADVRRSCIEALISIGTDADYAIAHKLMVDDKNDDVRKEASAQIEHHPKATSLEFLCKALRDSNDRIAGNAVNGLQNLGMKEGAKCLRDAAKEVKSDRLAGNMNKVAGELER